MTVIPNESAAAPRERVEAPTTLPLAAASQRLRRRPGRPRKTTLSNDLASASLTHVLERGVQQTERVRRTQAPFRSAPAAQRLLSLREAAAYLGVSRWTVSDWIKEGLLAAVRLPGSQRLVRVDRADLDELIARSRHLRSVVSAPPRQ
jgi:excisionase family DNA binding protein